MNAALYAELLVVSASERWSKLNDTVAPKRIQSFALISILDLNEYLSRDEPGAVPSWLR